MEPEEKDVSRSRKMDPMALEVDLAKAFEKVQIRVVGSLALGELLWVCEQLGNGRRTKSRHRDGRNSKTSANKRIFTNTPSMTLTSMFPLTCAKTHTQYLCGQLIIGSSSALPVDVCKFLFFFGRFSKPRVCIFEIFDIFWRATNFQS